MTGGRVQERGSAPLRPSLRDGGLSPGLRLNRGQVHQGNAGEQIRQQITSRVKARRRQNEKQVQDRGVGLEEHGGDLGKGDEAEKTELRPGATPRWWRFLSTAWLVPPPPAGLPRRTAPSAPCPGLPAPLDPPALPAASARPQPPAPETDSPRVRPAAAARARPLLPR